SWSNGSCTGGASVTCSIGSMSSGADVGVTGLMTANSAGTISTTASVTSGLGDPNSANNRAMTTTTANPPASADLSVSSLTDSPDPVVVGNNITYSVTVHNAGPSTATSVVLTDTIDAGHATYVSATGASCGESSGTVTCTISSMA